MLEASLMEAELPECLMPDQREPEREIIGAQTPINTSKSDLVDTKKKRNAKKRDEKASNSPDSSSNGSSNTAEENRKLLNTIKMLEKHTMALKRENEKLQGEHSKSVLARTRLEGLCRELQRQNKAIKNESMLRIRDEEEKRKEIAVKFQTTLNEITSNMQANAEKNDKLRDDSMDLANKFQTLCEQFQQREDELNSISAKADLERTLADVTLTKIKLEQEAERNQMMAQVEKLQAENDSLRQHLGSLQGQIDLYNSKYAEFEQMITKSGEAFEKYKKEIAKMSKHITAAEKDAKQWKSRWEKSNLIILELSQMTQQQNQGAADSAATNKKVDQLQKLCRQLQADRSAYLAQLNKHNIPVPAVTNGSPVQSPTSGSSSSASATPVVSPVNVSNPIPIPGAVSGNAASSEPSANDLAEAKRCRSRNRNRNATAQSCCNTAALTSPSSF